jgi:hypothetical protein
MCSPGSHLLPTRDEVSAPLNRQESDWQLTQASDSINLNRTQIRANWLRDRDSNPEPCG